MKAWSPKKCEGLVGGSHYESGGNSGWFEHRGGLSKPCCGREGDSAASRGWLRQFRPLDHRPRLSVEGGAGRLRQRRRLRQGRGRDRRVVRRPVRPARRRGGRAHTGLGPSLSPARWQRRCWRGWKGRLRGRRWGAWRARWSAGESRRSGPSNTRRRSREASSSSWFGASPRSSLVPGACSLPTRPSTRGLRAGGVVNLNPPGWMRLPLRFAVARGAQKERFRPPTFSGEGGSRSLLARGWCRAAMDVLDVTGLDSVGDWIFPGIPYVSRGL